MKNLVVSSFINCGNPLLNSFRKWIRVSFVILMVLHCFVDIYGESSCTYRREVFLLETFLSRKHVTMPVMPRKLQIFSSCIRSTVNFSWFRSFWILKLECAANRSTLLANGLSEMTLCRDMMPAWMPLAYKIYILHVSTSTIRDPIIELLGSVASRGVRLNHNIV